MDDGIVRTLLSSGSGTNVHSPGNAPTLWTFVSLSGTKVHRLAVRWWPWAKGSL